ncbi:MAG: beta-lactamase family protein [Bifidobacterium sp.]|jgi:CubicO group peptidase (beta-lactamase class C family)|nr:beta-lactamase family protein [Bifidobacterium sp.]
MTMRTNTEADGRDGGRPAIGRAELEDWLEKALSDYGVPGAQIGVMSPDGEGGLHSEVAYAGVTNQTTGYAVQEDTLFQIGSISKIWTTMLAMQLVDEGLLSLETRVRDVLPEFSIAGSPETTENCTVRHLMNHTSGIEGDAFPDLGRGDDCVERYVRYIGTFPARTPLGGPLSYSNGAFVVLGRMVEKLRGMTWDKALRTYIAQPAGLRHVWTLPEDVLRFSSALGHNRAVSADEAVFPAPVEPSDVWQLPRCTGPCGSVSASMGDLLSFASVFLNRGTAANGTRLLSQTSCELMTRQTVSLGDQGVENVGWALGWQLPNWQGEPAYGHGGATEGQRAKITVFPRRRMVVAVLTNAGSGSEMAANLTERVARRAGIGMPAEATVARRTLDDAEIRRVCGTYKRHNTEFTIRAAGETGLQGVFEPDPDDGEFAARVTLPIRPTAEGFYALQFPSDHGLTELAFIDAPGNGMYAAMGHRVTPRVA